MEEVQKDNNLNAHNNIYDVEMKTTDEIETNKSVENGMETKPTIKCSESTQSVETKTTDEIETNKSVENGMETKPPEDVSEPTIKRSENTQSFEKPIVVDEKIEELKDDQPSSIFCCSICKSRASCKTSKILKCSHTVCENCVLDKSTDDTVDCGFCKVKSKVGDLENHFLLVGVDESNNENQLCLLCEDHLIANFKCKECDDVMCADCVFAHKRVKLTKDHDLKELFKVSSVIDQCPTHKNQQLLYHCQTCDEITCPNCQLETHNGHDYQRAEDGVTKFRNEIGSGEKDNDARIEFLVELNNTISKRIDEVDRCQNNMESSLASQTSALLDAVHRRDDRLRQEIVEKCKIKRQTYETAKMETDQLKFLARHFKSFAEITRRCKNKLFVRRCAGLLSEKSNLSDLSKSKLIESTKFVHDSVKISLKLEKAMDNLVKIIENNGSITIDHDNNQTNEFFQSRGCSPINFPKTIGAYPLIPSNYNGNSATQPMIVPLQHCKQTSVSNSHQSQSEPQKNPNGNLSSVSDKLTRKRKHDLEAESDHNRCNDAQSSPSIGHKKLASSNTSTPNNRRNEPKIGAEFEFEEEEPSGSESEQPQNKKSQKLDPQSSASGRRPLFQQTSDANIKNGEQNEDAELNEPKESEDFCSVCQGDKGDFLKCSAPNCTRVFHRYDHVPSYADDFIFPENDPFICGFCRNPNAVKLQEDCLPKEKRISPKMTAYERQVAERVLLELYCHMNAEPFINLPDLALAEYYKAIKNPLALSKVRESLKTEDRRRYTIERFILDINRIVVNCLTFYRSETETYQKGKELGEFYRDLISKWLPNFLPLVDFSKDGERSRDRFRKRRTRDFNADTLSDSDSIS